MTEPRTPTGTGDPAAGPTSTEGDGTQAPPSMSVAGSRALGTEAPASDARPVGPDDRAFIAVFPELDTAEPAVLDLLEKGLPPERISIVGRGMETELRINGFVTAGDVAGPAAATGAWVGGLFGVLTGVAVLFVPGVGPLVVLGPLAAAAVGAAEGALVGGTLGAILGHFVERRHLPRYERLVRTGSYLVVVHGTEDDVARVQRLLSDLGSADVQRHDTFRGSIDEIGPIEKVFEGMVVLDANGDEVGKVDLVRMSGPEAVTTAEQDPQWRPEAPSPFAERLLRVGYIRIDRRGLLKKDVYAAATEIDRMEGSIVHLNLPAEMLLHREGAGVG